MVRNATPGYVTRIEWFYETTFQIMHEYVLFCVRSDDQTTSWIRVERIGDLPPDASSRGLTSVGTNEAELIVTLAPYQQSLVCVGDKLMAAADLDQNAKLRDVANLVLLTHQEEPQYHLYYHNCWWLARLIVRVLAETYMQGNGKMKKKVLKVCNSQNWKHVMTVSGSGPLIGVVQSATRMHFSKRRKRVTAKFLAQRQG